MKLNSRTFSFIITTLVFLTGYGFFVFAAPPGPGGYNPGETLDPECTPGQLIPEPCIVQLSSSNSGWSLLGNAGTDGGTTNFVGTTDAQDLVLKTNGNEIARFGQNGNVSFGNSSATGIGSLAVGQNSSASGLYSFAFGYMSGAYGSNSIAFNSAYAYGVGSIAMGSDNYSYGDRSVVLGYGLKARSFGEAAFGTWNIDKPAVIDGITEDSADAIFSIGNGISTTPHNAYTMWRDGSFAYNDDNFQNDNPGTEQNMFYFNYGNHDGLGAVQTKRAIRLGSALDDEWDITSANVGDRSIALGFGDEINGDSGPIASGDYSIAGGLAVLASGNYSIAFGIGSTASGLGSTAFGNTTTASGANATALGSSTSALGTNSTAFGGSTVASGFSSTAIGYQSIARSMGETVIGVNNTDYIPNSAIIFSNTDRIFNVGNGNISPSDAFTILKNGKAGIGYDNFETTTLDSLLQVNGSILSANLTGCDSLSSDANGKILCSGITNGLQMISGNIGLGGTLTQDTTTTQGLFDYTMVQSVPVTGTLVFKQGLTTVTGLSGNVMGYIANNGDAARTISWVSGAGNKNIHTLSGAGDPNLLNGGTEIRSDYDITDTTSGTISLYAFDTPNSDASWFKVTPKAFNFIFDTQGELQLNGSPGTAGYVIASNGPGTAPTWQDPNLLVSDERLKSNVTDLSNDTLSKLSQVKTVTYTLNTDQTQRTQVGFLAQDLEQYFPELVGQKDATYKGVYYAQMTPVLVEAIRELNLQMTSIDNMVQVNPLRDSFTAWLADQANGIVDLYAEIVHSKKVETEQLCIKDVCMDRDQLYNIMQSSSTPVVITPPTINSDPTPTPDPGITDPEPAPSDPVPDEPIISDPGLGN